MTEAAKDAQHAISTWSWVWQTLGVFVGAATLVSLIKNAGSIELHGLPARVMAQYTWLRDALFEPATVLLAYLGIGLAWWVKDTILAYGIIATAHYRGYAYWERLRPSWMAVLPMLKRREVAFYAATWPKYYYQIGMRHWNAARLPHKMREDEIREFQAHVLANREKFDTAVRVLKKRSQYVLINLVVMVLSAIAFFVWNHLSSTVGPS